MKPQISQIYMKEIGRVPLLTRKEEQDLARRIQKGDEAAREQMIRANLRLVVTIAGDYAACGMPMDDLVAEGNQGLMKAVERFDPERGAKFSVYASFWIKQSIRRALSNQLRTIRLPVHVVDKVSKLERAKHKIRGQECREPTSAELAKETGIATEKVRLFLDASQPMTSLETPIGDQEKNTLGEMVPDERATLPGEEMGTRELLDDLSGLMGTLDQREKKILRDRFGLGNRRARTLELIGAELGISRERVRQVQVEALEKLRRAMERQGNPVFRGMTPASVSAPLN